MNTYRKMSIAQSSISAQAGTAILKAILTLANTYAIAKNSPSQYGKYGYDFPGMIRIKLENLHELGLDSPWVDTFSNLLIKSLDSPKEVINICSKYLREMYQDNYPSGNRKEFSYAHK